MTNSNLKDFGNFHADLAQSAYTGRPSNFPFDSQRDSDKDLLNSGQSLYFDFSQDNKFLIKIKKNGKSLLEVNIFPIMARFTCSRILIYIL